MDLGKREGPMTTISTATIKARGLHFGEGPRWRDGTLYFSDMHAQRVCRWREGEAVETVATFPGPVSGLGWQPDGTLLVVSMLEKQVLRSDGTGAFPYTRTSLPWCRNVVTTWWWMPPAALTWGTSALISTGAQRPSAPYSAMSRPRGPSSGRRRRPGLPQRHRDYPRRQNPDFGESMGRRLTAFTIAAPGQLTERRVFADLPGGRLPDGICLDTAGGVWAASPTGNECLRLEAGGQVTHRVTVSQGAYACMLGAGGKNPLCAHGGGQQATPAPAGTGMHRGRIRALPPGGLTLNSRP